MVRAFIKDLGNVFDQGVPAADPAELAILFTIATGVSRSWTADRDYFVTGWQASTAGASFCVISIAGTNVNSVFNTPQTTIGQVWACISTAVPAFMEKRRLFLGKGTLLTVFNGAASNYPIVIYLAPA